MFLKSFNTIIHLFNLTNPLIVYSLSYLINAGLTDLEIELIDGFLDENFPQGCTVNIDTCIDPHFSSSPAFGLPYEVYDLVLYFSVALIKCILLGSLSVCDRSGDLFQTISRHTI